MTGEVESSAARTVRSRASIMLVSATRSMTENRSTIRSDPLVGPSTNGTLQFWQC